MTYINSKLLNEILSAPCEPDAIWGNGKAHKDLATRIGVSLTHDAEGNLIQDDLVYVMTPKGLYLFLFY